MFPKSAIRNKIIVLAVLTTLLTLFGASIALFASYYSMYREQVFAELGSYAEITAVNITAAVAFEDRGAVADILAALSAREEIIGVYVYDHNETLFSQYVKDSTVSSSLEHFDGLTGWQELNKYLKKSYVDQISWENLVVFSPIFLDQEVIGLVELKFSLKNFYETLKFYGVLTAIVLLVGIFLAGVIAARLQRVITGPIAQLTSKTKEIAAEQDYSARVEKATHDELGILIDHFNHMLSEIERRDQELAGHREHLELQVEERTQELRLSNQKLENAVEDIRAAKEAAEAASRAKSQFLANMSHEIRTPMHGVLGNVDLLLKSDLTERQRRLADTIHQSGGSLLGIIDDILDFSKSEAGRLRLELAKFDLWQALEEVGDLYAEVASTKGLRLIREVAPEAPRWVWGDGMRLRQVLSNLLSNAIKFTDLGEVCLAVNLVEEVAENVYLRFAVRDTGAGIAPERKDQIFEAFSQADESTTRRHGGTGLGLAICKQLVELMGGEIDVESRPCEGSTFWFTAPFKRVSDVTVAERAGLLGVPIFVVSDDGALTAKLNLYLDAWGLSPEALGMEQLLVRLRESMSGAAAAPLLIIDAEPTRKHRTRLPTALNEHVSSVRGLIEVGATRDDDQDAGWGHHLNRARISTPLRPSELYDTLISAVQDQGPKHAPREPRADEDSSRLTRFEARVLVAEDNTVNQELARECLDLLGCAVDVAADGTEVLNAIDQKEYDAILMDCHMPKLDGFETTRRIRNVEADASPSRHIPIIALTASAMKEDQERCQASGMDDFLAKPFTVEQLAEVLERWLREDAAEEVAGSAGRVDEPEAAPPPSTMLLDQGALDQIRRLQKEGKPDVLAKVIGLYLEDSPQLLENLREAVAEGNAAAIRTAAHTLKSSSANLGAKSLAELCKNLEAQGKAATLEGACELLEEVEKVYAAVCDALRKERQKAQA